jgi:hypothetical protein
LELLNEASPSLHKACFTFSYSFMVSVSVEGLANIPRPLIQLYKPPLERPIYLSISWHTQLTMHWALWLGWPCIIRQAILQNILRQSHSLNKIIWNTIPLINFNYHFVTDIPRYAENCHRYIPFDVPWVSSGSLPLWGLLLDLA